MFAFEIEVLQVYQTKGVDAFVGIAGTQDRRVRERAVARGLARKQAIAIEICNAD